MAAPLVLQTPLPDGAAAPVVVRSGPRYRCAVLTTATALERLRASLAEAGFQDDAPDLRVLFATWRAWAALPVEGMDPDHDDDMLLFECSLDLKPPDKYSRGPAFPSLASSASTTRPATTPAWSTSPSI